MRATNQQLTESVRELADWLERNRICGDEVCALGIDGFGDWSIHLLPAAFMSRASDVTMQRHEPHNHYSGYCDGQRIVACVRDGEPVDVPQECGVLAK